jgi:hypothetical protein
MVIFPDSMAMAAGLTFTIGQITWTIGSNDFVVTAMEEVQIQSPAPAPLPTTPATHRLLPRYQGRKLDNTDLIDSIDQLGGKLSFTLALVDRSKSSLPSRARTATIDILDLLKPPVFNG